ncbi:MAG: cupin domain-containing protein [Melioribacteraceae bacterium]|nr:cupin domain-containing protein [Melioribacteraceae bacterium]
MPVFNYNNDAPPYDSEVGIIEIIKLQSEEPYEIWNHYRKEKFLIAEGKVQIKKGSDYKEYSKGEIHESSSKLPVERILSLAESVAIRVGGKWGNEVGSCGVFKLSSSTTPKNIGDETDYERNTDFDNHFHDCDEFWIFYEGEAEIVTEGIRYSIKAGDCVFTKAGDHHDIPIVNKSIKGAWFETSLIGKKRRGHLWNHSTY